MSNVIQCNQRVIQFFPFLSSSYAEKIETLAGRRIVLFSYGSGLASSMFSLRASEDVKPDSLLQQVVASFADLRARLDARQKVAPLDFETSMKLRQDTHHLGKCFSCHLDSIWFSILI